MRNCGLLHTRVDQWEEVVVGGSEDVGSRIVGVHDLMEWNPVFESEIKGVSFIGLLVQYFEIDHLLIMVMIQIFKSQEGALQFSVGGCKILRGPFIVECV